MKTFKTAIVAAGFAIMAAAPALAETGNYAFVNLGAVVQKSAAGKAADAEIDSKGKQYQAELAKEDKNLEAAKAAFEADRAKMDREQYEKKYTEMQTKFMKAEGMLRERKRALQYARVSSNEKIAREAGEIIKAIAKEKGYVAVFTQDAAIVRDDTLDITAEVITRLDSKVSKVPVDWSGGIKKK